MSIMMQKWKNKMDYRALSAVMLVIVALLACLGHRQITVYEESVLSIYADQQDAYVQLVLDQINVQPDQTDEEIIQNILGSLDASNQKYWTLSKQQAILFVKDVTETNRYKGFTAETYYVSDSASDFVDSLELNQVRHSIIEMEEGQYVASGVIFSYNGENYKICLLTNRNVILDHNGFLAARIELYLFMGILLLGILLAVMILNRRLAIQAGQMHGLAQKNESLNCHLEKLEEQVENMEDYHTRWNLFHGKLMDTFVKKLSQREISPIVFMQLHFEDKKQRDAFLEKAQLLLDERALRFSVKEHGIILFFLQYRKEEAEKAMERMSVERAVMAQTLEYQGQQPLWECYQEFLGLAGEHGEEHANE